MWEVGPCAVQLGLHSRPGHYGDFLFVPYQFILHHFMEPATIFHIISKADWQTAQAAGELTAPSLKTVRSSRGRQFSSFSSVFVDSY